MPVRDNVLRQRPQPVARSPAKTLMLYGQISSELGLFPIAYPAKIPERPLTTSPTLRWQVDVPKVKRSCFQTDMKLFFWKMALMFTLDVNRYLKRWLAIKALQLFRDKLQGILDGQITAPPAAEVILVVKPRSSLGMGRVL